MIARCDDRGLGAQTFEFYRHMKPDVTVVVDMTPVTKKKWEQHFDWYPDGVVSTWGGFMNPLTGDALTALATCDVVYSAETFYDPRLPEWLHERNVRTVLQPNPELYRQEQPSELWWPTEWLIDQLPPGRVMSVPVPDDRIATAPAGEGLVLHVGGHAALADRNGAKFLPWMVGRSRQQWRIASQDGMKIGPKMRGRVTPMGRVDDRWELYDGCSVLVMPRRYGGLCLPVQEAMARGLAVVMTDLPHNRMWPIVPVKVREGTFVGVTIGRVKSYNCDPGDLIDKINLAVDNLEEFQQAGLEWARANAWSIWEPKYRKRMETIIDEHSPP
jgi:hypothetical protein